MKNFSSIYTFPLKFISPLLGILLLFLVIADIIENFEYWTLSDYLFLAVVISVNFFIFKFLIQLKKVKRIDDKLVISSYRKKIEVPISEITELRKSSKFIEIHFDNNNDFGNEILILPLQVRVIGSDPNASLQYIASNLDLRVTANGDGAVKENGAHSATKNALSSPD